MGKGHSLPKPAVKITADCPHCGSKQLESVFAKSTLCRKCGGYFDLEKLRAPELPETKQNSFFEKFGKLISRERTRTIRCYECNASQHVSSSAKSSICPHCSAYIDLTDFKISTTFSRSIQTQGTITITSKGDVTSTKVACGTAIIEGKIRGNLMCSGTARVKLKGKLMGSLEAHQLIIEKHSNVEFVRPIKVGSAEIKGKISARIMADGVVAITKSGCLEGTVYAKAITVDKGGIFHGELYIGRQELAQPDLLPAREDESNFLPGSLTLGEAT